MGTLSEATGAVSVTNVVTDENLPLFPFNVDV